MRLKDVETIKLLPDWIRQDGAVQGLGKGTDDVVKAIHARIQLLSRWNKIDELTDAELDELAYELNILWYDSTAPIETKRDLIRNSDIVYSKLGTKYAVEQIISAYFGNGRVREWFDYSGEPFHFQVLSDNPALVNENYDKFLKLLSVSKRRSAWLDAILICLTGELPLYVGMVNQDHTYERHVMGTSDLHTYAGVYIFERSHDTVRIGTDAQKEG